MHVKAYPRTEICLARIAVAVVVVLLLGLSRCDCKGCTCHDMCATISNCKRRTVGHLNDSEEKRCRSSCKANYSDARKCEDLKKGCENEVECNAYLKCVHEAGVRW